jgi:RNA polymerase sigma-70 factor (ECF subfamily)
MATSESTCWTVIHAAAAGSAADREEFARRYLPVVRAYLAAGWRSAPYLRELDDAVQEVFVECLKPGGALDRADRGRGFRPYLYGIARNVALRVESDRGRRHEQQPPGELDLAGVPDSEASLARTFDRAWARALLRETAERMGQQASTLGEAACRRVELLRLRFHEGLPIREIAARWQVDPTVLHHEYAKARGEFKTALLDVLAFHLPGAKTDLEQESANLLALLG